MFESEKPHYTRSSIILELSSILCLIIFIIFTYYTWPNVPQRIPDHFDWFGMPDSWGSKGIVPTMLYAALFIFILLSIVSRFPRIINFPIAINQDYSKSYLQLRFSFILWIKAELVLFTSYVGIQGIRVSLDEIVGLGSYFIITLFMVLIITSAIFIYTASKSKLVV